VKKKCRCLPAIAVDCPALKQMQIAADGRGGRVSAPHAFASRIAGIMEWWNDGIMGSLKNRLSERIWVLWVRIKLEIFRFQNPVFQFSIIPTFHIGFCIQKT
jgi:hypothetical protein